MIIEWTETLGLCIAVLGYGAYLALPLAAIVLAVDLLAGRLIAARYRCLMWMLVGVRMLIPITIESPYSVKNLWMTEEASRQISDWEESLGVASRGMEGVHVATEDAFVTEDAIVAVAAESDWHDLETRSYATPQTRVASTPVPEPANAVDWGIVITVSIVWLWFIVAVAMLGRSVISAIRLTYSLRRCEEVTDQATIGILLRVCDRLGVGWRPRLKIVPRMETPAVFGLMRTTICLPAEMLDKLSPDQLEMVLLHEMAHASRRDTLMAWLVTILRALQWVNPVAWLVHSQVMKTMEYACDEVVLRHNQAASSVSYGELLIQLAAGVTHRRHSAAIGLLFVRPTRQIARRLAQLTKTRQRNSSARKIAAITLLVAAAITGFTDGKTIERQWQKPHPVKKQKKWKVLADGPLVSSSIESEPVEDRTYDVIGALGQWQRIYPKMNEKEALAVFLPVTFDEKLAGKQMRFGILREISLGTWRDGKLTVSAPESIHHEIAGLIDVMERSGPWNINVSLRLISVPFDSVTKLGIPWASQSEMSRSRVTGSHETPFIIVPAVVPAVDWAERVEQPLSIRSEPISVENRPFLAVKITKEQRDLFVNQSQGDARTNIEQAPQVALLNGHSVVLSKELPRAFVVDLLPVRGSTPEGVPTHAMQPVIDVLREGTRVAIRTVIAEDDHCELQCRISESNLEEVGLVGFQYSQSEGLEFQTPRSGTVVNVACRLGRDQSLLIASTQAIRSNADRSREQGNTQFYLIETKWQRLD